MDERELYEICKKFVIEKQKASSSMLQREFKLGYCLSARIIDNLEKEGIISKQIGYIPRKVLTNKYQKSDYKYETPNISNNIQVPKTFDMIKDGIQFEVFIASLLDNKGYTTQITQKSNDYGADIIAFKDNIKYVIQCKFYSSPIGIQAVQEVLGAIKYYDGNVAIVATNNSFTNQAIELAKKSNVILWDGTYIMKNFI